MGMSIDEQIRGLEYLKKCGIFPFSDTRTGIIFTDECVDEAINTMRKYQKIEELYDYWRSGKCEYTIACMENIGKVLKNGNDD